MNAHPETVAAALRVRPLSPMIAISPRALLIAKLPTLGAAAMKGGGAAGESTPITPLALHDLLVWLSVASAFIAALLWFYASSISVPTDIKSGYGALLGVEEMSAGFKKQRAGMRSPLQ
jgi:hypothetical protein